ncbi:TY1B-PL [Symbiodinium sp. KB8]|nr:TY1B-PL [Symbiodinium sp. KB8]
MAQQDDSTNTADQDDALAQAMDEEFEAARDGAASVSPEDERSQRMFPDSEPLDPPYGLDPRASSGAPLEFGLDTETLGLLDGGSGSSRTEQTATRHAQNLARLSPQRGQPVADDHELIPAVEEPRSKLEGRMPQLTPQTVATADLMGQLSAMLQQTLQNHVAPALDRMMMSQAAVMSRLDRLESERDSQAPLSAQGEQVLAMLQSLEVGSKPSAGGAQVDAALKQPTSVPADVSPGNAPVARVEVNPERERGGKGVSTPGNDQAVGRLLYPISPGGTVIRPPPPPQHQVPDQWTGSWETLGPKAWGAYPPPPPIPAALRTTGIAGQQASIGERSSWMESGFRGSSGEASGNKDSGLDPPPGIGEKPEEPTKTTLELPKLDKYNPATSAIVAGDWLIALTPVITSLSASAWVFWEDCVSTARLFYAWLSSSPLERLHIQAEVLVNRYRDGRYSRVDQRAVSLLLAAVGSELKDDLISLRLLGTCAIVFKVMAKYQPGGAAEKQQLLSFLVSPDTVTTSSASVKALRKWRRWLARARELQAEEAILSETADKGGANQTVAKADEVPGKGGKGGKEGKGGSKGAAKADAGKQSCRLWRTDDGCKYGKSCTFAHDALTPADKRCFNCSSTKHRKPDCPYPRAQAEGKGSQKGKSRDEAMKAQDKAASETEKSARDELIAKANAVLESIQTSIKAVQLGSKYPPKPGPLDETGLIDSGATTCMRVRRGDEQPVGEKTVSLAQGEVQMGFSAGGVLLASEEVEPIVSLRQLIAIGFRLVWSKRACQLFDEEGCSVPLSTVSGCPRVCKTVAQNLIDRIETFNIHGYGEDQLARVREADTALWEDVMFRVAESVKAGRLRDAQMWHQVLCGKLFPELPRAAAQSVSLISNGTGPPGAFNRRRRRAVERSTGVVLHLFCGKTRHEFDSVASKHGATVIAVDLTEDLNDPATYTYLLKLALAGKVVAVISGPGQSSDALGCSVDWARWAPGFVQAVGEYVDAAFQQGSTVESLRRLQVQQSMKDHVLAGHVPYRKDCYACVAGRAKKQNHYRQTVSDSFVLSVDLAGPFKRGVHEGAKARYFLAAVFSIPRAPELNGSKGDKPEATEGVVLGEPGEWEKADEDDRDDDDGAGVGPIELDDAPEDPEPQPLEQLELVHLPFVVPLPSKGARDVMNGIKGIEARLCAMGCHVARLHSDAGKEFCNNMLRTWAKERGMHKTNTGGDRFKANPFAENLIGILKGCARTLMKESDVSDQDWPYAIRHACAQRFRDQAVKLGWDIPRLIPFGSKVPRKGGGIWVQDESGKDLRWVTPKQQATEQQLQGLRDVGFKLTAGEYQQGGVGPDDHDSSCETWVGVGEASEAFDPDVQQFALKALLARECKLQDRSGVAGDCDREGFIHGLSSTINHLEERCCKADEGLEYSVLPDAEVLTTHTVPLEEVERHYGLWSKAVQAELDSLVHEKQAVRVISSAELQTMQDKGTCVTVIPSKMVFTRKAGGRYKARLVACGNHLGGQSQAKGGQSHSKANLYAGGIDPSVMRQAASIAVKKAWKGGATDITTAFLNAELLDRLNPRTSPPPLSLDVPTEVIVLKVPSIVHRHGHIDRSCFMLVCKALYGLDQSPRDWSIKRDGDIESMSCEVDGVTCMFEQSLVDSNLWYLRAVPKDGERHCWREPVACMLVYVDDLLAFGPSGVLTKIFGQITSRWKCGPVEWIPEDPSKPPLKFFGFELRWDGKDLLLGQQDFIRDVASRYPEAIPSCIPAPPGPLDVEDSEERRPEDISACQTALGEVLWVAGRTRPDVIFAVSRLAQTMSRDPATVRKRVMQLIGYLAHTQDLCLRYRAAYSCQGDPGATATPNAEGVIEAMTDSAFAPVCERSQESTLVYTQGSLTGWITGRQPFTAASTAESELLSLMSGFSFGRAQTYVLQEFIGNEPRLIVLNDNMASISIVNGDSNGWRSRHLRIRAHVLREQAKEGHVVVGHIEGVKNIADAGTKALPYPRLKLLRDGMGLEASRNAHDAPLGGATKAVDPVYAAKIQAVVIALAAVTAEAQQSSDEPEGYSVELWILMFLVCCTSIALWEGLKWACRWCCRLSRRQTRDVERHEPEAERSSDGENQPDDEDELEELSPRAADRAEAAEDHDVAREFTVPREGIVARYVDDVLYVEEDERLRRRRQGQRVYHEEPDFEPNALEAFGTPPRNAETRVRQAIEAHRDARGSNEGPDWMPNQFVNYPVIQLRADWPAPEDQPPLAHLAAHQSAWGGLASALHQLRPNDAYTRDEYTRHDGRPNVLIRWHFAWRVMLFDPNRTTSPIAISSLTGRRRTVITYRDGSRELLDDNFRLDSARRTMDQQWVGRTELEVRVRA